MQSDNLREVDIVFFRLASCQSDALSNVGQFVLIPMKLSPQTTSSYWYFCSLRKTILVVVKVWRDLVHHLLGIRIGELMVRGKAVYELWMLGAQGGERKSEEVIHNSIKHLLTGLSTVLKLREQLTTTRELATRHSAKVSVPTEKRGK